MLPEIADLRSSVINLTFPNLKPAGCLADGAGSSSFISRMCLKWTWVENEITYSFCPQKALRYQMLVVGFFGFFCTEAKMTLASINAWKLLLLAPDFLDYGSLWGCSEARIPAVCESVRNFWPINCFDSEFCRFLMVVGFLSEKNADNVHYAARYATFDIGRDGQNPDVRRGQPEWEREREGWGTERWI